MKRFVFFHGYQEEHPLLDIDWDAINRLNNINTIITPNWGGITYTPTWVVNPGLITYTPGYHGTITTTPNYYGTGYITIPCNGTINTATGYSLTTSNPNGITYTTTGTGGTLTTGTATFNSGTFTSNFK
jgi:hypothetical protein